MQHIYDLQLARKKYPEPGNSVHCQLLRYACQALTIHGQKNHKIVIDRGFTSINIRKETLKAGQHVCGTVSLHTGLTHLKDKSKELIALKTKGVWAFWCHTAIQLGACIRVDSSDKKS